jgi:signal peptidase II
MTGETSRKWAPKNFIIVAMWAVIIAVMDQATKLFVLKNFQVGESRPVLEGFFNLVLVFNKGAAFGFLSDVGDGLRHILLGLTTAIALGTVVYLLLVDYFHDTVARGALGLIIGGAIGNIIDRIRFGQVVDFLDFYYGSYHWPAFNVADSAICVGVAFLILRSPKGLRASKVNG